MNIYLQMLVCKTEYILSVVLTSVGIVQENPKWLSILSSNTESLLEQINTGVWLYARFQQLCTAHLSFVSGKHPSHLSLSPPLPLSHTADKSSTHPHIRLLQTHTYILQRPPENKQKGQFITIVSCQHLIGSCPLLTLQHQLLMQS